MQTNLPTPMEILNAFHGVPAEQMTLIINELQSLAANDDKPEDSTTTDIKVSLEDKEPILEI